MNEAGLRKAQAQADQDDIVNAISAWIMEQRQAGKRNQVFPKYFYCNTRTWEDEVAPHVGTLLAEMRIEVRTNEQIPPDKFSFMVNPAPARDVALYLRQYDALPARA